MAFEQIICNFITNLGQVPCHNKIIIGGIDLQITKMSLNSINCSRCHRSTHIKWISNPHIDDFTDGSRSYHGAVAI
ncbi:hypothetical protein D3C73_1463580 [compost metagenome]